MLEKADFESKLRSGFGVLELTLKISFCVSISLKMRPFSIHRESA